MLNRFYQDSCGTERVLQRVLVGRAGWLLALDQGGWLPGQNALLKSTHCTLHTKLVGLAVAHWAGSGWAAGCVDEGVGWAGQ